jgi:hypothetical protein
VPKKPESESESESVAPTSPYVTSPAALTLSICDLSSSSIQSPVSCLMTAALPAAAVAAALMLATRVNTSGEPSVVFAESVTVRLGEPPVSAKIRSPAPMEPSQSPWVNGTLDTGVARLRVTPVAGEAEAVVTTCP